MIRLTFWRNQFFSLWKTHWRKSRQDAESGRGSSLKSYLVNPFPSEKWSELQVCEWDSRLEIRIQDTMVQLSKCLYKRIRKTVSNCRLRLPLMIGRTACGGGREREGSNVFSFRCVVSKFSSSFLTQLNEWIYWLLRLMSMPINLSPWILTKPTHVFWPEAGFLFPKPKIWLLPL